MTARNLDALAVADELARSAGALLAAAAGDTTTVRWKGRNNLVTEADHASEALILAGLAEAFPDHRVLAEESRPDTSPHHGYVWVVDPLDGTRNFAAGIPTYCVNIALLHDGEALLGATYEPARNVCILGGPGLGLRANGAPVACSTAVDLASSIVAADLGYDDGRARLMLETLHSLWPGMQGVRIPGAAAIGLAWAASGLAGLNVHSMLYPWDIAAGLAQVPAGGGLILDRDGGPASITSEGIAAGAPAVVAEFMRRVADRPWR